MIRGNITVPIGAVRKKITFPIRVKPAYKPAIFELKKCLTSNISLETKAARAKTAIPDGNPYFISSIIFSSFKFLLGTLKIFLRGKKPNIYGIKNAKITAISAPLIPNPKYTKVIPSVILIKELKKFKNDI